MSKKITVNVVPVQGKSTSHEVDATHTTVEAVLKAAGIPSHNGLQFSVNGEPAKMTHEIKEGDTLNVTEKVKGS